MILDKLKNVKWGQRPSTAEQRLRKGLRISCTKAMKKNKPVSLYRGPPVASGDKPGEVER
jgi:hypothetical protein